MVRKLTIEEINEALVPRGIVCVVYGGKAIAKSTFQCSHGHKWETSVGHVRCSGSGCPHCSGKARLTIEEINEALAPRGITCVVYGGGIKAKSTFQCGYGHEWYVTVDSVKNNGTGCPHCSGKAPLTIEGINEELIPRGISCLVYGGNNKAESTFKCPHGHEWNAKVNNVKNGNGCPHCAGLAPLTIEGINEDLASRGITCVIYGGNNRAKSTFKCSHGHEWDAMVDNVKNGGSGCPICCEYGGYNPDKPGTLYLLCSECGNHLKIGISNVAERRIAQLRRTTPFGFNVIERFESDGKTCRELEVAFHQDFEKSGFKGFDGAREWLLYNPDIIDVFRAIV